MSNGAQSQPPQPPFGGEPSSAPAERLPGQPAQGKPKRRAKNFMLQPLLQVKLGIYVIGISVVFALALSSILYFNFSSLINSIVLMTDAEEEVREIIMSYWRGTQVWIYLAFFIYLVLTIAVSVLYTHKLVGPTIAFRRHIRMIAEGRYNARTYLRKGDAFVEVAEELNRLSEVMERKSQGR